MKKSIQIKVYGKVQGVWYRASTQRKAEELQIFGFVRNEVDGSVYIEAEGEEIALEALVEWCKEGSPFSKVERLEINQIKTQHFTDFKILR